MRTWGWDLIGIMFILRVVLFRLSANTTVPFHVYIHILITNLNSDCGVGDVTTVPLESGLEGSLSSSSVPLAHA